jgi:hypothetical protein
MPIGLLEGLKYSFSIQIGPRSRQNSILQVSSIIGGRSFLLNSWRLLLCSLRLRQKYQAPTANKKAEGTAVVYRSKFGSPMSQMAHKQTCRSQIAMSALPPKAALLNATRMSA